LRRVGFWNWEFSFYLFLLFYLFFPWRTIIRNFVQQIWQGVQLPICHHISIFGNWTLKWVQCCAIQHLSLNNPQLIALVLVRTPLFSSKMKRFLQF
jgi:hypothetical protein